MRIDLLAVSFVLATAVSAAAQENSQPVSSSFEESSTTTISLDLERQFQVAIHPSAAIRFLALEITWSADIDAIHCFSTIDGVAYTVDHEHEPQFKSTITIDYGTTGLQQSQSILGCTSVIRKTDDAGGQPHIKILEVKDMSGNQLEGSQTACVDCRAMWEEPELDPDWADPANGYDLCGANLCGDAVETRTFTTSDALLVLQGSAGNQDCPIPRCDVDRSGETTASDALRVLKRAVGLPGALLCAPRPGANCFSSTGTTDEP